MNMKTILMMMMIFAVPVVFADWIGDNGMPTHLVYGRIWLANGTSADGAQYTIKTYNHLNGGCLASVQTGTVGEVVEGMLYNSRNSVDTAGDTIIVTIVLNNQSITIVHSVTLLEEELHVINLGNVTLTAGRQDAEEKEKTTGVRVDQVRLTRGEYLSVGEVLGASIRVLNDRETELQDVSITVGVPDLGIVRTVGPFDLDDGDEQLKNVYLEIPEWAKPGDYTIRISISNRQVDRTVHRLFTVLA